MRLRPLIISLRCVALLAVASSVWTLQSAFGFEGHINVAMTQGSQTTPLVYTVGANKLRIECPQTDLPHAKDIVNLDTGDLTLLFPANRSFVQLKSADIAATGTPAFPGIRMPPAGLPPGVGPQPTSLPGVPGHIGPTNLPGTRAMPSMPAAPTPDIPRMPPSADMPAMPMMPMMMMEPMELKATKDTTNLLGYTCLRYELHQRGEAMEIWATDKLPPFEPYLQNQGHRFGPRMIEDQWGQLVKAKKLFPLLAVLRFERPSPSPNGAPTASGPERLRFEVKSITPEKIEDSALFQPPPDYHELPAMPF